MNSDFRQSSEKGSNRVTGSIPQAESNPESKIDRLNILALLEPRAYPHPVKSCELIETHISWVILTGEFAYKIKKPVDLGFLDFSTLEKRLFYCREELRLNRRLAANIYLDVIAITGTAEQPVIKGLDENNDQVIDYAVKMRQFPQPAQLDRMLLHGGLRAKYIDAFARRVATFHQQLEAADKTTKYGDLDLVWQPVWENFEKIRKQINDCKYATMLDQFEQWSRSKFEFLKPVFQQRKQDGFIRECHGDMHLRNLVWLDNKPVLFDCIEFNPELRWIDVISDIAFLVMDLQDRQQPQLAQRFLNQYLEYTGDYAGLAVLSYYMFYRAMVRAKVDAIRASQAGISRDEKDESEKSLASYLELAQMYTRRVTTRIIITRGLSASGKTTITQALMEQENIIRIRSDVERKRLFGLKAEQDARAEAGQGIYISSATERTYEKLAELAGKILDSGYSVVVDATFLNSLYVKKFKAIAKNKQIPFCILEFKASKQTLEQRIINRKQDASDADLAVLDKQVKQWQELSDNDKKNMIAINTEKDIDIDNLIESITAVPLTR